MPLLLRVWGRETIGATTVEEGGGGTTEEVLVDIDESWTSGDVDEGAGDPGVEEPTRSAGEAKGESASQAGDASTGGVGGSACESGR